MAIFSESRKYGNFSLDYYLLTPKELTRISKFCEDKPQFIYSSADGPKPTIIHLHCFFEQKKVDDYLTRNKFDYISQGHFKKGTTEIKIETDNKNKVIVTTVYEYL